MVKCKKIPEDRMKFRRVGLAAAAAAVVMTAGAEEDLLSRAPWSGGAGLGYVQFEGDEELKSGLYVALRLGYDFDPHWTLEMDLNWAPELDNRTFKDTRYHLDDGTYMLRLNADILYHLRHMTRTMQWDPYLSLGAGVVNFGEDMGENEGATELVVVGGAGLFYHFDDEWAVRLDARMVIAGGDTEFNALFAAGVNYRFGAQLPVSYAVTGGNIDSDGDGLYDNEEPTYGTDPYDPDTDKDGLTDGQEVKQYKTNPLDPDSDIDGLKDGAEVLTYKTNPLDRDTDKGGVADGHEVIEDNTDPLNPADDLQLFTLNIEFDYDKSFLRPIYFDQLDVVAKVLQRDPGATARIEGHADKRKTSKRDYNIALSERRAKAVLDYLVKSGGIAASRLTHKGYGFDRPVAPNDTEANMQKNRRTEIYIRPSGKVERSTATPMVVPTDRPAEPAPPAPPGGAAPAPVAPPTLPPEPVAP